MKLYATVTSERASKGQGGNEYLEIQILGEGREDIGYIKVTPDGTNYRIAHTFTRQETNRFYVPKGNKQKGDKCETCGAKYTEKTMWCAKCEHLK